MSAAVTDVIARWSAAEAAGTGAPELLAEDFLAVGPVGFTLDATAWTARHAHGLATESLTITVGSVRQLGGVAVVVGVQEQRASYGAHRSDGRFRITMLLRDAAAGWEVVGLHLSGPIPEGVP